MKLSEKLRELSNKKSFTKEEVTLYDFLVRLSKLDSLLVDIEDSTYLIVEIRQGGWEFKKDQLIYSKDHNSILRFHSESRGVKSTYFTSILTKKDFWTKDHRGLIGFSNSVIRNSTFYYRVVKLEF